MKKSAAAKESKTSKAAVNVRELPPKHETDVRGGISVTKSLDDASTSL